MDVREARRITGRHLMLDEGVGAGAELVFAPGEDVDALVAEVRAKIEGACPEVLGAPAALVVRRHPGGVSLALRAPADLLETAATLMEWAADPRVTYGSVLDLRDRERSPRLLALLAEAEGRRLPAFFDDDGFTVGLGARSRTWPLDDLPDFVPDLGSDGRIPVVFVTGTNGKTTTTRLLARMAREAGHVVGNTSSDGLVIQGEWVSRGDWTGPGAARQVLRDERVTFAALETARGGMMRRGLVFDQADAAVVTNVASDHLGEWGLWSVADMARAKLQVARGLRRGGSLVVNSGCEPLMAALPAMAGEARVFTFSEADVADLWADREAIRWRDGRVLVPLSEVPVTAGGRARHNVENALAAALVAHAVGLPEAAIVAALRSFQPSLDESRGRMNRFRLANGAQVILDFAHNPHGVARLVDLALSLPAERRMILLGQAGDRTDPDIFDLAATAARLKPALVVVKELTDKLRGRRVGEVPTLLRQGLLAAGVPESALEAAPDELTGCARILEQAGPEDLVLYLVHGKLEPAIALIEARGGEPI